LFPGVLVDAALPAPPSPIVTVQDVPATTFAVLVRTPPAPPPPVKLPAPAPPATTRYSIGTVGGAVTVNAPLNVIPPVIVIDIILYPFVYLVDD
jgi:hypothetical protein